MSRQMRAKPLLSQSCPLAQSSVPAYNFYRSKNAETFREARMKTDAAYKSASTVYDDYIAGEKFPFNLIAKIIWGFKDTDYTPGLLEKIPDGFSGKLLDIPAGTGILTCEKYARLSNARIVCADYSTDMLNIAQQRFADCNLANVSCVQCDVGAMPFENETFDAVLSMNGFHAFPDKEKAFAEISRVLKKGGIFVGCFYAKGITRRTDRFVRHVFVRNGTFTPPFYTKTEIIQKLQNDYDNAEVWNTGSIVCFSCKKPERGIDG
jgi:SAM-dependent methyltransferase